MSNGVEQQSPGGAPRHDIGAIESYARRVLGPCEVDATDARAASHVLAVLDSEGRRWFVKHVPGPVKWRAEVQALEAWEPAIRGDAPRLRHADHDLRAMTMSEVPGSTADKWDPRAHRRAGRLLSRLHRAAPPSSAADTPRRYRSQFAQRAARLLASDDQTLLTDAEAAYVRDQVSRRALLPAQPLVACHGDYRPGNWIQDERGRVRVIDFGGACLEPWAFDLVRLAMGPWWERPRLARAFLQGYGRELSDDDRKLLTTQAAVHSVVLLRRARRHHVPRLEARARDRLHVLMDGHPGLEV